MSYQAFVRQHEIRVDVIYETDGLSSYDDHRVTLSHMRGQDQGTGRRLYGWLRWS